jgi:hypothetical protein
MPFEQQRNKATKATDLNFVPLLFKSFREFPGGETRALYVRRHA